MTQPVGMPLGDSEPELMKNADRINEIRARMKASASLELRTSLICRAIRRDFNMTSTKMYVFSLNPTYRSVIRRALSDLEFEITLLHADCAPYFHVALDSLIRRRYDMLVVSPESATMYRVLRRADHMISHVYAAYLAGHMTREQRDDLIRPFLMAYNTFKATAMKMQRKSVDEELASLQILG